MLFEKGKAWKQLILYAAHIINPEEIINTCKAHHTKTLQLNNAFCSIEVPEAFWWHLLSSMDCHHEIIHY